MITTNELDEMARGFDTSRDFDAVMAYYDMLEIKGNLKGKKLLEVGTSAGTVTKHLLALSERLDIVEGSKIGLKRTRNLLGSGGGKLSYFHSLWEDFEPKAKYSDIIFVRGLEHVENPVALLKKMKGWMVNGGRMHIIVPNANSLHRKILVSRGLLPDIYSLGKRDFQVGHKRIYDMNSLLDSVTKSGLRPLLCRGFFLKPISTSEMGKITMNKHHPLVVASYEAGKIIPNLGTQIYLVAEN